MKMKEVIGFILIGIALVGILLFGVNRFERIENGEMILVNQNEMDR